MSTSVTLRRGPYVDSVTLMQVSKAVSALPGVRAALVAMATELNLDLAVSMGFALPEQPSPNDMLVAVEAVDEPALDAALVELDRALTARATPQAAFGQAVSPRTVRAASRSVDGGAVTLVSTPGRYAFLDAIDAVDAGQHVMVFSDNVPVEQEVALKRYAADAGVLVMGPDCGTAVLGGVALGFANVVRPGPVGIVAASGTGAQQVMALLDGAGVGISHCLGVGGRDLSAAVGGLSTVRALDLLAADPQTEVVVLVSKPPAESVAARVRVHAAQLGKPVVLGMLGPGEPDLTEIARRADDVAGRPWVAPERRPGCIRTGRPGGSLRGLFTGGSLCDEAMLLATESLGEVRSNIPLKPSWGLDASLRWAGHTMIDFGDDRLTRGRPHPMIDGSLRNERFTAEVEDATCGVLLIDVVLGLGAAPDPSADLVPLVRSATAAGLPVLVSLVGTADDPQDRSRQASALNRAGAWVFASNAEAARRAVDLLSKERP